MQKQHVVAPSAPRTLLLQTFIDGGDAADGADGANGGDGVRDAGDVHEPRFVRVSPDGIEGPFHGEAAEWQLALVLPPDQAEDFFHGRGGDAAASRAAVLERSDDCVIRHPVPPFDEPASIAFEGLEHLERLANVSLRVQRRDLRGPFGDASYVLTITDGRLVRWQEGTDPTADVRLDLDFAAAMRVRAGELAMIDALGTGKARGELPYLMLYGGLIERPTWRAAWSHHRAAALFLADVADLVRTAAFRELDWSSWS